MGIFGKKCEYCKNRIEKKKEIFKDVKIPTFVGTRRKAFCCQDHADRYKKEIEEYTKKPKQGGGCCG